MSEQGQIRVNAGGKEIKVGSIGEAYEVASEKSGGQDGLGRLTYTQEKKDLVIHTDPSEIVQTDQKRRNSARKEASYKKKYW